MQPVAIGGLMATLHERGQFDGAILVAARGNVVYRGAFGKANVQTGADFTPETPSDIGSVTKQFTAMSVMILSERQKLHYDDPVAKFIPELSSSPHLRLVTLRQLLNHTSGIPDYGDLDIDDSGLDQKGLISALLKKESLFAKAGWKYRYSNPGYALLGIVVERVSASKFGEFLQQEILQPAGMRDTFLYDSASKRTAQTAIGYGQFGQVDDASPTAIPGDGGMLSTADDLFKWDQALYADQLVRHSTLDEAFTPGRVEGGASTYGFGWNIEDDNGSKYLWHTGSHAGFRAFIGRRLAGRVTVILLTNRGNSKRREINTAIESILSGRPYTLPKRSGAEKLYKTIHESGLPTALQTYRAANNDYDFGESEINTLGYQLLGEQRVSDAVAIFQLNTTAHPVSSNAFDSLGEAYARNGERNHAIVSYMAAVLLDPSNGHASDALRKLQARRYLRIVLPLVGLAGILLIAILVARRRRSLPRVD